MRAIGGFVSRTGGLSEPAVEPDEVRILCGERTARRAVPTLNSDKYLPAVEPPAECPEDTEDEEA